MRPMDYPWRLMVINALIIPRQPKGYHKTQYVRQCIGAQDKQKDNKTRQRANSNFHFEMNDLRVKDSFLKASRCKG